MKLSGWVAMKTVTITWDRPNHSSVLLLRTEIFKRANSSNIPRRVSGVVWLSVPKHRGCGRQPALCHGEDSRAGCGQGGHRAAEQMRKTGRVGSVVSGKMQPSPPSTTLSTSAALRFQSPLPGPPENPTQLSHILRIGDPAQQDT